MSELTNETIEVMFAGYPPAYWLALAAFAREVAEAKVSMGGFNDAAADTVYDWQEEARRLIGETQA